MARKASRKAKRGTKRKQKHGGAKPRKQWSAAYRKRIEHAEAKGLSRQAARGHRAKEHVTRKEMFGLSAAQSSAVGRFARAQARRDENYPDPDRAAAALKAWVKEKGYRKFEKLRDLNAKRHAEKRTRQRRSVRKLGGGRAIVHFSIGQYDLSSDFEEFDLPDMPDGDSFAWLFYH
jgi:hypothetical protein